MGAFDTSGIVGAGFGNRNQCLSQALSLVDASTNTDNTPYTVVRKFLKQLVPDSFDWIVVSQPTVRVSDVVDLYGIKE